LRVSDDCASFSGTAAKRAFNSTKRHFMYTPPRHATPQWIRLSAWIAAGGFSTEFIHFSRPDYEIEFQYKLLWSGYAIGLYDCQDIESLALRQSVDGFWRPAEGDLHKVWQPSRRFYSQRKTFRFRDCYATPLNFRISKRGRAICSTEFKNDGTEMKILRQAQNRLLENFLLSRFPLPRELHDKTIFSRCTLPSKVKTGSRVTIILLTYLHVNISIILKIYQRRPGCFFPVFVFRDPGKMR